MNRIFCIFFFSLSLSCFSQHVEVLERMQTANLSVQEDFEYLFIEDKDELIPVAIIQASGKNNIAELFASIQQEANKLGANCFKVVQYLNDDATSKQSSLTLKTFFAQQSILLKNDEYNESNVIYIFGKDKKGDGKTSFKLNNTKYSVENRTYFRYENEAFQEVEISKGGLFGTSLSIFGNTNQPAVFLTLSGLGVAPTAVFERYVGAGLAYGGGGLGLSFRTGNIEYMKPNLALLLIELWEKEYYLKEEHKIHKSIFKSLTKNHSYGEAFQFDINESWSFRLEYDESENGFFVTYPDIYCDGLWLFKDIIGNKLILEEMILIDPDDKCINRGVIHIEYVNDKTFNFYYYTADSPELLAKGIIKK